MPDLRRWCAAAATATAALGAVGLAVAVGGSAPFRYVSESGVPGAPHAGLYRASMLLVAAALALLAVPARHTARVAAIGRRQTSAPHTAPVAATRRRQTRAPRTARVAAIGRRQTSARHTASGPATRQRQTSAPRTARVAAVLRWQASAGLALAAAAPLAAVSGVVSCSPGCPLPPYEASTPRDLVHATGAIGALLLCALVMLSYAVQPDDTALRRLGRVAVACAFPLLVLSGIGVLFVGRGMFTGVMERAALVAATTWLVFTAALHLRAKP